MAQPAIAVFPLEKLVVEGNQRVSVERIVALTGLKTGEPVLKTDFDRARRVLLES